MEIDLYQRRGMYGLGQEPTDGSGFNLANIESQLGSQSPWVVLGIGALGLWVLSGVFSKTKKVYGKVARPIKKRRKKQAALKEAEERYESERRRIERGSSGRRGGGGFF